ncbi:MAG: HPr kinase/phosphatase C-terminal domain-containing protein [Cypionkella sp.]|uniref:HPr kinase/phosphorylase n=1 Tax=Cypionkella sp. TaxID=2811411 RepID=UPI002AB9D290|nr:HPr kinase/phosphatase C-terminal domain-containing protein [Cypionkella sp.]MDZ4312053.1 HPr kinase/phosphatase C-terminal domain-containing protein [Cypionkella sp.]MDZ4391838.1 HPr kinase/phosphatase C-terminal domain-containing protein [Cypionkella sp.]
MTTQLLHASCVAVDGRCVLITGASGTGKSALALQLIGYGASLIADDQTRITLQDQQLIASCPPQLSGMIEARGIGLLHSPARAQATITLVVDLDQTETHRLPPKRITSLLGVQLPLVLGAQSNHFPASVLCYLKGTRLE